MLHCYVRGQKAKGGGFHPRPLQYKITQEESGKNWPKDTFASILTMSQSPGLSHLGLVEGEGWGYQPPKCGGFEGQGQGGMGCLNPGLYPKKLLKPQALCGGHSRGWWGTLPVNLVTYVHYSFKY